MLGRLISDPEGVEGRPAEVEGLGLFDMNTVMESRKQLNHKVYRGDGVLSGVDFSGYEMHMGKTEMNQAGLTVISSVIYLDEKQKLLGTYLHGLFENGEVVSRLIKMFGCGDLRVGDYADEKEKQLDLLAETIKNNCDISRIMAEAGI
jgi:adenosylcobyric acid synthase